MDAMLNIIKDNKQGDVIKNQALRFIQNLAEKDGIGKYVSEVLDRDNIFSEYWVIAEEQAQSEMNLGFGQSQTEEESEARRKLEANFIGDKKAQNITDFAAKISDLKKAISVIVERIKKNGEISKKDEAELANLKGVLLEITNTYKTAVKNIGKESESDEYGVISLNDSNEIIALVDDYLGFIQSI